MTDSDCKCSNKFVCKSCYNKLKNSVDLLTSVDNNRDGQLRKLANQYENNLLKNKERDKNIVNLGDRYNNSLDEFNNLKTQFYTAIGFLLIVTTAITSAVYFYSQEIPAVIKEHRIFSDEWYGPALYFAAPILLLFFTFLFAIWFYNNIKHKENYPIFRYFKNNLYILILLLIIDYYCLPLSYNWSIFWLFIVNIFLLFSKPVQLINEKLDAWIDKKTQLGIDKVKKIFNKIKNNI